MSARGPRFEARQAGATRYFTGKPCRQRHVAERHVVNGRCCACAEAWKVANPEKVRAEENSRRLRKARAAGIVPKRTGEASLAHRDAYRKDYAQRPNVVADRRARVNKRLREDPIYLLNQRTRCRMHIALKRRGGAKSRASWESLVGYTAEDLKRHLERQFLPGMSWANAGTWHIDHRRPLALYAFTSPHDPEFKAAWALTNLQPLWGPENLSKGAKLTVLL